MTNKATGGCLCGAVKYQVTGVLRPVVACHCTQCQKTSGHHVAATSAPRENIALLEEQGLKWYFSSKGIRRGFVSNVVEIYFGIIRINPLFLSLLAL